MRSRQLTKHHYAPIWFLPLSLLAPIAPASILTNVITEIPAALGVKGCFSQFCQKQNWVWDVEAQQQGPHHVVN